MSKKLSYRVVWSEEDNEYVATCDEFASLSWLSDTPEDALIGLRSIIVGEDLERE